MTAFSVSQMMSLSGGAPVFARQIVDNQLSQYSYLIGCQRTGEAILRLCLLVAASQHQDLYTVSMP